MEGRLLGARGSEGRAGALTGAGMSSSRSSGGRLALGGALVCGGTLVTAGTLSLMAGIDGTLLFGLTERGAGADR
jgi:hypothetical protein